MTKRTRGKRFAAGIAAAAVLGLLLGACRTDIEVERTKLPYIDTKPKLEDKAPATQAEQPEKPRNAN